MTDIVEQQEFLRILELRNVEILNLMGIKNALQNEVLEQARLLGMSGEREAGLRGEIERLQILLKKEYERGWDDGHIAGREKGGYERLCKIAAAAKNLISVKGRHHAELAYKRLEESLK